jgi:PAS domain S-box-containing protein
MNDSSRTCQELIKENSLLKRRIKKLEVSERERKESETALRASELMYQTIFETTGTTMLIVEEDMTISLANDRFENLTGYRRKDVEGKRKWTEFVEKDDLGEMIKRHRSRRTDSGSATKSYEFRLVHRDGSRRNIILTVDLIPGTKKSVASLMDITDRKQAEERLRESERKYHELYDYLPIPVYEMDLEANITSANRAIYETFRTSGEIVRKGFKAWQIILPEDIERAENNRQRILAGEQIGGEEYNLMRLDGSIFPAIVYSRVISSNDKPVGIRGVVVDITERRRQEEELRRVTAFLDSIIENIPDMIFVKEARDLRFVRFNRAGEELLGYSRDDLLGKNDHDFFPKRQADFFMGRDRDVLQGKEILDIPEEPIKTLNKGTRILHTKKVPILDAKGEPAYLLGISEDITDRRAALEALRETEDRYRDLFDNSRDLICTHDLEGKFISINSSGAKTFGYGIDDLIGKHIRDFISPNFRHDFDDSYMAAMKKHGYARGIMSIQSGKGDRRILEYNNSMRREEGKTPIIRGIVRDITESWKTQRALEKSERKYRSIVERAVEGIFQYDQTGRFISVNQSMARMCGYDSPEQMMELITDLASQFFARSDLSDRFRAILEFKEQLENFEHKIYRRDGTEIWVSTNLWAVKDIHGKVLHYEGTQMDISERIAAEKNRSNLEHQLAQSQKMEAIGTLAGGIAHDFNNILSGIMGYSELCMKAVQDRPKLRNYMEQVLKATGRARDLVHQIMTFSRKTDEEKKPIIITPVVKEVVKFMRASLPTTIEIRQDIDENVDAIMGDHTKIHQLLMNLFTNALHAMKETGGILEVGLKEVVMEAKDTMYDHSLPCGRYLELSVRDTGHGISQEYLERIFDPYFTTKKQGEGTGLGLSVVHGIVNDHGGDIRVYSEEGKGTIFRVYLPLIEQEEEESRDAGEDVILTEEGGTILFVDDEQMVVDLGRELLESIGYKVVAETDPVHAVEVFKAKSNSFDLIVTDKTMPHMTGFDVIRQVRDIRGDIPVILSTGLHEKEDLEKLKTFGITQIIAKPTSLKELAKAIHELLDKKKET